MFKRINDRTSTTSLITISLQEYERLTKESAMLATIASAANGNIIDVVAAVKMVFATDPQLAASTRGAIYE